MNEEVDQTIKDMLWAAYSSVPMVSQGGPVKLNDDGTHTFVIKQNLEDGSNKVFEITVKTSIDTHDEYWGSDDRSNKVVIDNRVYSIGKEPSPGQDRTMLGMAGRQFTIDFFDGRTVVTHNLWAGGKVPEKWRHKFPNTATFRSSGEVRLSDGGSAWSGDETYNWSDVRAEMDFSDVEELQIDALREAFRDEL